MRVGIRVTNRLLESVDQRLKRMVPIRNHVWNIVSTTDLFYILLVTHPELIAYRSRTQ
jgi:hypothetical protein